MRNSRYIPLAIATAFGAAVMLFPAPGKALASSAEASASDTTLTLMQIDSVACGYSVIDGDTLFDRDSVSAADTVANVALKPTRKTITPVESDDHKPEQPILHYYDKHGEALKEPVYFLSQLDTVKSAKPGPVYPTLNGLSIGFNFFDAILMAAGQKYGGFDLWADLSIHNWFFPVVEAGVGFAKSTPLEGNFTYKGNPGFYAKIGANYNFLYKSNQDYQVFAGLRAGMSHFSYDITDITINSSYWDQTNTFSLLGQRATSLYGEVLGGIKVKLYKHLSMGWTIRYHFKFHTSDPGNSNPWYIPGYGAASPINFTFSLVYTIPFHNGKKTDKTTDTSAEDVRGS